MFQAPKLTNAGKKLYYENMAGNQLVFTTIQMGNGKIFEPVANMTKLVNKIVTISASVDPKSSYVDVSGAFSNAQLTDGFYWREIGVFAADAAFPTDRTKDILYCYQNAYDTADFIPTAAVETVEKNITVPMIVGDTTTVSCTLSKSLIFATLQNLDDHVANATTHIGTAEKAAAADGDSVVLVDSADAGKTKRLLWGNIKALFAAAKHGHTMAEVTIPDDAVPAVKFTLGVENGKLYMMEV